MAFAPLTVPRAEESARVFEELPELLQQVRTEDIAALTQVTTPILRLPPGEWQPPLAEYELRGHLGFLALDGLMARQVTIGDATCAELLGGGDVLRPWTEGETDIVSIPAESSWQILISTRLAVLDARFSLRIARWPEVMAAIADHMVQRARWLAFHLALCQLVGIEVRLLILFWHLADRWGKVTPEGVKLPLPLSQGLLAAMVGSRRPTVSTALGVLRDKGLVEKADGHWTLRGDPPHELHELREDVAARGARIVAKPIR
jgi:CRP-like cAMP-binding protein